MASALLAEFEAPEPLAAAVRRLREQGASLETFTPYPVSDVQEALELPRSRVPLWCFAAAALGGAYAFLFQAWMNGVSYPLNVGGRPLVSIPSLIPITFELTVLSALAGTLTAFLAYCRLPRLSHPLFEVEGFERASVDRFFLACDPGPRPEERRRELADAGALRVIVIGERP